MSDLVGNPEDRFSRVTVQIITDSPTQQVKYLTSAMIPMYCGQNFVRYSKVSGMHPYFPQVLCIMVVF